MKTTHSDSTHAAPAASGAYWQRIFRRNPQFCSWHAPQQQQVLAAVRAHLDDGRATTRVLDFRIGNLGLYRALADEFMRRMVLTGISESPQHDPADPLLASYRIRIVIGPGVAPLARVAPCSQDVIVCTYVFAYLPAAARAAVLSACARILVAGGTLLLVLHHPRGERARKFRCSEPYWPQARQLYDWLLQAHYGNAAALLQDLTDFLDHTFGEDHAYRSYLASYLKTARRFLKTYGVVAKPLRPIAVEALADCEQVRRCIEREMAMTCQSFHPVQDPRRDLALPGALNLARLEECVDPSCGEPIANVLTAIKKSDS